MARGTNRRGRGRPATEQREKGTSRRELIDAAIEVFAERGYRGASIEEVIRRAGLSKGTFYFNFANKEELFAAVVHDRIDAPARQLIGVTSSAPGDVPTAGTVSAGLAELMRTERTSLMLLQ